MNRSARNPGFASVMGMIYLVVMSALAVGFFTAVDMANNVSDNEQNIHQSLMAADQGMTFARYQLANITLPAGAIQPNLMSTIYSNLSTAFNPTGSSLNPNLGGHAPTTQGSGTTTVIQFPGKSGTSATWASADAQGGQFYVTIAQSGSNLTVTAVGQDTNAKVTPISRKEVMQYYLTPAAQIPYGLVTGGSIDVNGSLTVSNAGANDNIMSLGNPPIVASATHTATIGGDVSYTSASPNWTGVKVDTTMNSSNRNFSSHVHQLASAILPTIDTSGFTQFALNPLTQTSYSLNLAMVNVVVPANTSVTFTDCVISGVVYMEDGASVTFNGGTINGSIVQDPMANSGSITFNNDVALLPVTINNMNSTGNQLLVGTGVLPSNELNYDGTAILAPTASITFNSAGLVTPMSVAGTVVGYNLVINKNLTLAGALVGISSGIGSPVPLSINNTTSLILNTPVVTGSLPGIDENIYYPLTTTYSEQ